MTMNLKHFNLEEIDSVADVLLEELDGGSIVVLVGEMGAGKTTLVKACGRALGVIEEITSPTFSIIEEHLCGLNKKQVKKIIHVDTYRIEYENEILDIGLEEIFDDDAITFIEWGERIETMIDDFYWVWTITENQDGSRSISISTRNDVA